MSLLRCVARQSVQKHPQTSSGTAALGALGTVLAVVGWLGCLLTTLDQLQRLFIFKRDQSMVIYGELERMIVVALKICIILAFVWR
jgi:hypothetical protein